MQGLDSEIKQEQRSSDGPIAVLQCEYGATLSDAPSSQPLEHTTCTPLGTISSSQFGKAAYTIFKLQGAEGRHVNFHTGNTDVVQLVYVLEGACNLSIEGVEIQGFHAGEHNSFVFSSGSMVSMRFTVQSVITLVAVGLERQHFLLHLPPNDRHYQMLVNRVSGGGSDAINRMPLHITPEQAAVLHDIIDCKRQPFIRHHYINVKISELLVLHLEQWAGYLSNSQVQDLREEELRRVYNVRDMLHQEPNKSYSLVGLAHAVGTNDATLKKHFKQVFGTSVFAYLTAYRMELAKSLLLNNNQKVAAVAQEVGYKYASHFSTAFRKYFGYLPTKLLRSVIAVPIGVLFWEPFL